MAATDHRPRNNKEIILTEKTEEILLGKQKRYCWENRDDKEKTEASPRCGVVTPLFFCGTARVMNFSALRPPLAGRLQMPAGPPLPYCCETASAMYCNIPDMDRMGCRLQRQAAGFVGCWLQSTVSRLRGLQVTAAVSRLRGLQVTASSQQASWATAWAARRFCFHCGVSCGLYWTGVSR